MAGVLVAPIQIGGPPAWTGDGSMRRLAVVDGS
jgi:hypothetical protein